MRRSPGPDDLARAYLAGQARWAATRLHRVSGMELDELLGEMVELPTSDVSLQLRLPPLLTPEMEALRAAVAVDDEEGILRRLPAALAQIDTPRRRADLARAVVEAREARVAELVAAVGLIDLAATSSGLLQSSLLEALAVDVGATTTPRGLLVVHR